MADIIPFTGLPCDGTACDECVSPERAVCAAVARMFDGLCRPAGMVPPAIDRRLLRAPGEFVFASADGGACQGPASVVLPSDIAEGVARLHAPSSHETDPCERTSLDIERAKRPLGRAP